METIILPCNFQKTRSVYQTQSCHAIATEQMCRKPWQSLFELAIKFYTLYRLDPSLILSVAVEQPISQSAMIGSTPKNSWTILGWVRRWNYLIRCWHSFRWTLNICAFIWRVKWMPLLLCCLMYLPVQPRSVHYFFISCACSSHLYGQLFDILAKIHTVTFDFPFPCFPISSNNSNHL